MLQHKLSRRALFRNAAAALGAAAGAAALTRTSQAAPADGWGIWSDNVYLSGSLEQAEITVAPYDLLACIVGADGAETYFTLDYDPEGMYFQSDVPVAGKITGLYVVPRNGEAMIPVDFYIPGGSHVLTGDTLSVPGTDMDLARSICG